jgi:hypothetical protein
VIVSDRVNRLFVNEFSISNIAANELTARIFISDTAETLLRAHGVGNRPNAVSSWSVP